MADKAKLRTELEERLERIKRSRPFSSGTPASAPAVSAPSRAPVADPLLSDRARRLIREEQRVAEERERAAREERRTAQEGEKADKAARGLFRSSRSWFQRPSKDKERPAASPDVAPETGTSWASILIIILGVLEYFFRVSNSVELPYIFGLSLIIFIFAGYSLAHFAKKDRLVIFLPMLAFVIWYFVYGGNYDPRFLTYFLSICVVAFGLPIVFTKGESITALLLGFIPVLFLFLDIGLVPFLVERLHLPITPLLQNLILFMPWWALFGVVTLPGKVSENSKVNFLVNVARVGGIIYLIFIILAPALPNLGYDKSLLPEAGEFESAQARLRGALPQRENPAYSNFWCLFFGEDKANIQGCVEQRQQNSEIDYICEQVEGKQKGTSGFTECVAQQRKLRQEGGGVVGGVIDPTIKEPTKAELVVNKEALPQQYNPALAFPVELKVGNPRKQLIRAQVSCAFVGKTGTESVSGRIEGVNPLEFSDPTSQATFLCYPEAPLQGNYRLTYNATLSGLTTISTLQRAFIGNKSPEEKERLRREEVSRVITEDESKAPADFAVINFDIGHARKEIIIENKPYRTIVLTAFIQNKGPGKITAVHSYSFNLGGFSVDNPQCVQGSLPLVANYPGSSIPLSTCVIRDYPEELKPSRDWVPHTFTAALTYDYKLTKEIDLTIKPGGEVSP